MATQISNPWAPGPKASAVRYTAAGLDAVSDPAGLWKQLADSCPDAWFWHTWDNMQFNFVAARKSEVRNLSFFVLRDGRAIGLVPLMVNRSNVGDVSAWEASYYGAPLPWPAFVPDVFDLAEAEDFAIRELEARALSAQAERIRLRLEPPTAGSNDARRFERAVTKHRYLDSSYLSHFINLDDVALTSVRERYRRYVRKFAPLYELSVVEGDDVTSVLEQTYFELHVKDAGGQFRSRDSYRFQANLARSGQGFFAVARNRASKEVAGMLLVSVFKGAAYDNSVAVDPQRQDEYVSHLLKWTAIEMLLRRAMRSYELGAKSSLPTFMFLPSEKNRGISHFKDGWARSSVKTVLVAEKFLSARFLQAFMQMHAESLRQFFGLRESGV